MVTSWVNFSIYYFAVVRSFLVSIYQTSAIPAPTIKRCSHANKALVAGEFHTEVGTYVPHPGDSCLFALTLPTVLVVDLPKLMARAQLSTVPSLVPNLR
jgi:hypothetical protein